MGHPNRQDPSNVEAHKAKMVGKAEARETRYQALRKHPIPVMPAHLANQSIHGKIKKGLVKAPKNYEGDPR
jgi:hypothetical protein